MQIDDFAAAIEAAQDRARGRALTRGEKARRSIAGWFGRRDWQTIVFVLCGVVIAIADSVAGYAHFMKAFGR